jgi:hypothetical protein
MSRKPRATSDTIGAQQEQSGCAHFVSSAAGTPVEDDAQPRHGPVATACASRYNGRAENTVEQDRKEHAHMDDRRQYGRPATMEQLDELVREPLSPGESRRKDRLALLSGLAALLVVTVVGTSFLVIRDLRAQGSQTTNTTLATQATATVPSGTPTPKPSRDPKDYGWTQVTPTGSTVYGGDVKFSASSPQRGYLCGEIQGGPAFGVTTDGGQTWVFKQSSAANEKCSIQVSPTNALDVAIKSDVGSCGDPCPGPDTHYSTDGGATWKAAPIPQNTLEPVGALWSSSYLYVWSGPNKDSGQSGFLKVSANGGAFTLIDPNTLLSSTQGVSIEGAVATSDKLYLNIGYNGCSLQNCWAIMASANGGQTWTQISNKSSILLIDMVGGTLYGQMENGPTATPVVSSNNGVTWTTQTLPLLPNGQDAGLCVPAPDGTCITATPTGVAYLRAGAWTILPFATYASDLHVAVSLDASGKTKAVWVVDDGNGSAAGIYWHAL